MLVKKTMIENILIYYKKKIVLPARKIRLYDTNISCRAVLASRAYASRGVGSRCVARIHTSSAASLQPQVQNIKKLGRGRSQSGRGTCLGDLPVPARAHQSKRQKQQCCSHDHEPVSSMATMTSWKSQLCKCSCREVVSFGLNM